MARMTIYIPDDLKGRMDKTREEVNWSQLACAAFERRLRDIASGKERKNMDDVIERLRASKQSSGYGGRFKAGFEVGQEWARETAEAKELENLERFREEAAKRTKYEKSWTGIFDLSIDQDYDSLPEAIFYRIRPTDDEDHSEAEEFWQTLAGDEWEDVSASWYRGFCEGALEIWAQVKDKL